MRDVLDAWERMTSAGAPVGRAVVTRVWGSAPRAPGACLLATPDGELAGSVSGGCVESAAAEAVARAIERGNPEAVSFGVSNETAWSVGLACGGTIDLWIEPAVRPELIEAARGPGGVVLATALDGPAPGTAWRLSDDDSLHGPLPPAGADAGATTDAMKAYGAGVAEAAREVLRTDRSGTAAVPGPGGDLTVFLELVPREPHLVVYGGVHIAIPLVAMARHLGFRTTVADARPAFLTRDRFPDADALVEGWPDETLPGIGLDPGSYVVVLTHDPKLDDPALALALRSPARYVGALGSRKTQRARRERLRAMGLTESEVGRLHGPVGLPLGGRHPAETALSILAEMTAVRYGAREALDPREET